MANYYLERLALNLFAELSDIVNIIAEQCREEQTHAATSVLNCADALSAARWHEETVAAARFPLTQEYSSGLAISSKEVYFTGSQ
jgi:hypothetical protein